MTLIPYDVTGVKDEYDPWPEARAIAPGGPLTPLPELAQEHERYRLYSVDDLGRFPPAEWLVPPYLAARELTGLFGKGDTYKSFIALHWACTLARSGRHVIYIAAEGATGLQARVGAWMKLNDVEALPTLHFMPSNVNLHTGSVEVWIDAMRTQLGAAVPSLVIVDTLARNFVGGSENDAKDLGHFVEGCEAIRRELGTAVLVIHHTTKDGETARGGESFRNAAFAMFKSDKLQLTCDRMKEAQPPPATISVVNVALPELGEGMSSLVVRLSSEAPKLVSKTDQLAQQILALWATARPGPKMTKAETARRVHMAADHDTFRNAWNTAISTKDKE